MNKQSETMAEIRVEAEAEFRKLIDLWITQTKRTAIEPCERLQAMQKFNNYFDRLEAAAKRDHLRDAAKMIGNDAAAAIKAVIDEMDKSATQLADAARVLMQNHMDTSPVWNRVGIIRYFYDKLRIAAIHLEPFTVPTATAKSEDTER